MSTLLIALGAFVAYLIAYHTYGRWLARRVFQLDKHRLCPSEEVNDGQDYVPAPRSIVFGHHFTSIAGTGPIVGPAIAVFWGWLPALLWVLFGAIFMGAVHDLGALVVSLRSRGMTIGDVAGRLINRRARLLFLTVLLLSLTVVIGIFGLVIATIFAAYPSSVFPIWVQIPLAIAIGVAVYRYRLPAVPLSLVAVVLMFATIGIGAYWLPVDLSAWGVPLNGAAASTAGISPYLNAVVIWTIALLVYCFFASVLPVWVLLQPRDFINAQQLLVALALLVIGLFVAPLLIPGGLQLVAAPINHHPPAGAPPIWPFLFITIACGAISGFHCLVSSGTTSKQLRRETDAQFVGYGGMLLEGALAVLVILACCAGLSRGIYDFDASTGTYAARLAADGTILQGQAAWDHYYSARTWSDFRLVQQVGGFIEGGANILNIVGVPISYGISLMAVLVACFAATTLDTATRLQRYVITELAQAIGWSAGQNRYVATTIAVGSGGALAMISGPAGPGSGGLILWPVFGVTNQLLAGLSFLVIAFYLLRHRRPVWFLVAPLALMIALPAWGMLVQLPGWLRSGNYPLFALALVVFVIQIWMVVEAALLWPKVRGVLPAALPPLRPSAVQQPAAIKAG